MKILKKKKNLTNNRKKNRFSVCVLVEEPGKKQEFFDKSLNISESGIFIETDNPKEKGQDLTLRFALPGTQVITVTGKVSRVKKKNRILPSKSPPGMGIEFTVLDPKTRKVLKEFTEN